MPSSLRFGVWEGCGGVERLESRRGGEIYITLGPKKRTDIEIPPSVQPRIFQQEVETKSKITTTTGWIKEEPNNTASQHWTGGGGVFAMVTPRQDVTTTATNRAFICFFIPKTGIELLTSS